MILFDFLSACSLGWLFVLIVMNIAANPSKTIERGPDNSLIEVQVTPDVRRHRLMMMAFATLLPMLTALLHLVVALSRIAFIQLR